MWVTMKSHSWRFLIWIFQNANDKCTWAGMLEGWRSQWKTWTTLQRSLPPSRRSVPRTTRSPEPPGITQRRIIQVEGSRKHAECSSLPQPSLYSSHSAALTSFSSEETWRAFYFTLSPTSRQYGKPAGTSPTSHAITKPSRPSKRLRDVCFECRTSSQGSWSCSVSEFGAVTCFSLHFTRN